MKNPILTGTASCIVSGIFWTIILLGMGIDSENNLGAAGVYILWIVIGAPLSLIFTSLAFWATYRKPKLAEPRVIYSVTRAKVVSWVSLAMVVIPAAAMTFFA